MELLGRGAIAKLPLILDIYNIDRVLIVTGMESYTEFFERIIVPHLSKYNVYRFCEFTPNAKFDDVIKGVNIINLVQPSMVIAIGGGTVIDIAKLINIASVHGTVDSRSLLKSKEKITSRGKPLIAIPTTAGTGSEATQFGVVYIDNYKYSLSHKYLLPDHVILDSDLAYSMPRYLSASSAIDALSQAIESYWALSSTNQSKQLAAKSIDIILKNITNAVIHKERKAIDSMLYGANLSGKAINITKTTAPHALSYAFTSSFNVSHGHAVGLTLGKFFILNYNRSESTSDKRGAKYLRACMDELFSMFSCSDPISCHDKWYSLMNQLGLDINLGSLGINSPNKISLIVESINVERLMNHPIPLDAGSIRRNIIEKLL